MLQLSKTLIFLIRIRFLQKGFIIAGDHSVYGSIEGAVLSGINASKKILN